MKKTLGFTIEGECLVGKSTALRSIKDREDELNRCVLLVPEYFEVGSLSSTSRSDLTDVKRIQGEIIDIERRRSDLANDKLANQPNGLLGFDRSFFSCLAYELAVRETGGLDGYQYLLEMYEREYVDGNIILPSQVIQFNAHPNTIELHRQIHLQKGHRDIPDFLRDLVVRKIQNEFIADKGKALYRDSYSQIDVDNMSLTSVANDCIRHLNGRKITDVKLSCLYA